MKSIKDYSLKITEEEYHALPAWSHSLISRYAGKGFSSIATLHDRFVPTSSMEFGSLFDSMLTKGKATLDEYMVDDTAVPPAEKSVFDYLLSQGVDGPFKDIPDAALDLAAEACPTFASKYRKPETRRTKLAETAAYYEARRSGKRIVSRQDWDDAAQMYRVFRNDKYLKTLFGVRSTEDVEYLYQTKFVVDYTLPSGRRVKVKFMPDLLVVNHAEKTVQPVDLKTSSMPAYDFKENFLKYRYDIQANLYTCGLRIVISNDADLEDYTVLPYLFTDISRADMIPVTYVYDPMSESQVNGLTFCAGDRTYSYKGWQTLLDEIITYEESQAKVPSYIKTGEPNDLLSILSR